MEIIVYEKITRLLSQIKSQLQKIIQVQKQLQKQLEDYLQLVQLQAQKQVNINKIEIRNGSCGMF
ncbi:hypothetical protein VQL36_18460 [Chengkuizengella sp. SCS-71B]|uniref:hypothetical protein n=1 Tax=Chengkuizengella sp. SCS-71B TaxID=3115290 RepID=UPI0032C23883